MRPPRLRRAVPAPEGDQGRVGRERVLAGEQRRLDVRDVGRAGGRPAAGASCAARERRASASRSAPDERRSGDQCERGAEDRGESASSPAYSTDA